MSDHFELRLVQMAAETFEIFLINTNPGHMTEYVFSGQGSGWYNNVSHLERAFGRMSTKKLDNLRLTGTPVLIENVVLQGGVVIENEYKDIIDLKEKLLDAIGYGIIAGDFVNVHYDTSLDRLVLTDVHIEIDATGGISVNPLDTIVAEPEDLVQIAA